MGRPSGPAALLFFRRIIATISWSSSSSVGFGTTSLKVLLVSSSSCSRAEKCSLHSLFPQQSSLISLRWVLETKDVMGDVGPQSTNVAEIKWGMTELTIRKLLHLKKQNLESLDPLLITARN